MITQFRAFVEHGDKSFMCDSNQFAFIFDCSPHGDVVVHDYLIQFKVKKENVMQGTNLKDKNNKPIFEHDIVRMMEHDNTFYQGLFEVLQSKTGEWRIEKESGGAVLQFNLNSVEVVGNAYENRELLDEIWENTSEFGLRADKIKKG